MLKSALFSSKFMTRFWNKKVQFSRKRSINFQLQNLSKKGLAALTNLSKNKDLVIQKFDKGNSVVIVDKDTYIKIMENLLIDQRKFEKVRRVTLF